MFTEEAIAVTPADGILLPKTKLSIIEQKNKANYCLTRKELDDFTTHMSYFLYNMVQHSSATVEFKNAVFYLNEKHNMNSLPCSSDSKFDDAKFGEWFTECVKSENYLEENIEHVFNNYFMLTVKLSAHEHEIVKQQVEDAVNSKTVNVDFLDKIFTPSDKTCQAERIRFNYSTEDVNRSGDFIIWQAARGLLHYTVNSTGTNFVDKEHAEQLAYRMLTLFTDEPDILAVTDFIRMLPNMWH